jgi:magnesium transporter
MADETIANIGGTAERLTEDEPTWRRFLARAPWLVVTLFAGMITATGFSIFQDQPWFLAVPFFVPLITGMSGNVGIQCSTVLIRSMATGEISASTVGAAITRELKIGVLIGICFGCICGLAAYALNHAGIPKTFLDPVLVGTIVSSGVLGACFTATVLGTLSPLFFARFRIDPAIASGPIVTAFNDVTATYMYFVVAWFVATIFEAAA